MPNPYCKNLRTIIFDIETMGLMSYKDMVINAGFCDPETGDCFQLFAESKQDEERLIRDIYEILSHYEVVITYNGNRFDIPFIKARAKKYGIDGFPFFWSLDLYRYFRKYWPMAERMEHLNQKSVEIALGLSEDRDDKIGGGECIPLYEHYLCYKDEESKQLILLHNADDVKQLAKIYNAANFLPYDKISFEQGFGVPAKKYVICESMRLDKNYLYIKAKTTAGGLPCSIYEDSYEIEYDSFSGCIEIKILLYNKDGLCFVDLSKLPVNINEFKELKGYHSDYLVLKGRSSLMYQEINCLASSILSNEDLF